MKVNEKIKNYREKNKWSQEDMANQLQMSASAYAKIERGDTRLHLDKLQQIAQIFLAEKDQQIQTLNEMINLLKK